ncbi:MAG TPA: Mov34/MPN/PAD-1 family protein [Polyangiaceae bacterium]|nr:Mov34/MPN/PAD-1 family protein [Polyangiaceae bacterium]
MTPATTPWIHGHVRVQRAVLNEVERAAREAYARDEEACGYLEGPLDQPLLVDRAVELENLANKYHRIDPENHPRTGRTYFKINGLKFEKAISAAAEAGRAVKIFFHSHLDVGSYFSAEDAASMTMGGNEPTFQLAYLVTAIDQGVVTAHRTFVWSTTELAFVEAPFEIVD